MTLSCLAGVGNMAELHSALEVFKVPAWLSSIWRWWVQNDCQPWMVRETDTVFRWMPLKLLCNSPILWLWSVCFFGYNWTMLKIVIQGCLLILSLDLICSVCQTLFLNFKIKNFGVTSNSFYSSIFPLFSSRFSLKMYWIMEGEMTL